MACIKRRGFRTSSPNMRFYSRNLLRGVGWLAYRSVLLTFATKCSMDLIFFRGYLPFILSVPINIINLDSSHSPLEVSSGSAILTTFIVYENFVHVNGQHFWFYIRMKDHYFHRDCKISF
jgi:hypothetical protein